MHMTDHKETSKTNAAAGLVLPPEWEATATGMRSLDGQHVIEGFHAGSDPRGERLLVVLLDGNGEVTAEPITEDLHSQLVLAARRAGIARMDGAALGNFAEDLYVEMRSISDTAREEFYSRLAGGDLYELLSGAGGGIGPRHPHNVAAIMREGPRPKPMLVDDWLVATELHWIAAEPSAGKTWFGLWLAYRVIAKGGTVVWTDEELGDDTVAERLLALGANPDLIEERFVYLPFPGWDADAADVARWEALVKNARPALTVIDTATDALAEAGLDENSGVEVTQWVKAYCEPPRRVGSAVLVLDHTVKAGLSSSRGYAVGSRAKKAKAKVQFSLEKVRGTDFDSDLLGQVEVKRTKLGVNGAIPLKRTFEVGGDGAGHFLIKELDPAMAAAPAAAKKADKAADLRDRIEEVIREKGPLTTSQVKDMVTGRASAITNALAELAESDLHPIDASAKSRSTVYTWTGESD
jgi:hypothetical protein